MKHKPTYHFRPDKNWINDPNAPIYYKGEYHLFYQHNPDSWEWGNLHWGHAKSRDMIHWEHLPLALAPAKDRGENYCFSGCGYIHNDKIELLYTSIGTHGHGEWGHHEGAQQWVATTEDMVHWKQIPENPVLSNKNNAQIGLTLIHWRDPYVFRYKGETLMVIAGVIDGWKGAILIYRSKDMRNWEFLNTFFTEDRQVVYECPNVVVFEDKIALIYTVWKERLWSVVGTMNEDYSLNVLRHGPMLDPGCYYATNVFTDDTGRKIMWGWLQENDRNGIITDGAWSGAIALPRILSISPENELLMTPAVEDELLRGEKESCVLEGFQGRKVFDTHSASCEVHLQVSSQASFALRVMASEDGQEYTELRFSPRSKVVRIAREKSSLLPMPVKKDIDGRFTAYEGDLNIRVFLDNSIIEIYVNNAYAYSARVYPTREDACLSLEAFQGNVNAKVDIYHIEKP